MSRRNVARCALYCDNIVIIYVQWLVVLFAGSGHALFGPAVAGRTIGAVHCVCGAYPTALGIVMFFVHMRLNLCLRSLSVAIMCG